MNVRELLDAKRLQFVQDATISPTRAIVYQRDSDQVANPFNSFVGVGSFTKTEKDTIGRYQSFGGLALTQPPKVSDLVIYDSIEWKVIRHIKMGSLYTVFCENKRHKGKPV